MTWHLWWQHNWDLRYVEVQRWQARTLRPHEQTPPLVESNSIATYECLTCFALRQHRLRGDVTGTCLFGKNGTLSDLEETKT